jgi:AcrR family transcriptional regulator
MESAQRRERNRRGEGERLRHDLIQAATELVEADGAGALSLRRVARQTGVAATSVYLHFPDLEHLLAAVMAGGFEQLTAATTRAAAAATDPLHELRLRCRAYCVFGLGHPRLYEAMFQVELPTAFGATPEETPGRRSFQNLLAAVQRCVQAGVAPAHEDPFRLASLIWAGEHGLVLARLSRPTFPWAPIDELIDEMVDRLMAVPDQDR